MLVARDSLRERLSIREPAEVEALAPGVFVQVSGQVVISEVMVSEELILGNNVATSII